MIAYLMRKNEWGFIKALEFLKEKRPRVKPNQGFVEQLKEYQISLEQAKEEETDKENKLNNINLETINELINVENSNSC